MKRNFVMMLVVGVMLLSQSARAEEKKPSKEETVSFINNTLANEHGHKQINEDVFAMTKLGSVDGCTVQFENESGAVSRAVWREGKFRFDLKNIEKVSTPKVDGWGFSSIRFTAANSQNLIGADSRRKNIYGEIETDQNPASSAVLWSSNEKLAKAFNHLRKLCGAPEPLEF